MNAGSVKHLRRRWPKVLGYFTSVNWWGVGAFGLVIGLCCWGFAQGQAGAHKESGADFCVAILIGASDYQDENLKLPEVRRDIQELERVLLRSNFSVYTFIDFGNRLAEQGGQRSAASSTCRNQIENELSDRLR